MILLMLKFAVFSLYFISIFGWGSLLLKLLGMNYRETPYYTASAGISLLIFLGGVLNASGFVYPEILTGILVAGIMAAGVFIFPVFLQFKKVFFFKAGLSAKKIDLESILKSLYFFLTGALLFFLLENIVPASVYNVDDDLQKYIPRSIRMMQTGSLGGDPFNSLGLDSLGAQFFLQGFIINYFSINFLNSFDAVFCLLLISLLLFDLSKIFKVNASYAVIPLFFLIIINPQQVNISSLYSGILIMLSLIISLVKLADIIQNTEGYKYLPYVIVASLFSASLISLKNIFWPYISLQMLLFFVFMLIIGRNYSRIFKVTVIYCFSTIFFVLPWLVLCSENYLNTLSLFKKAGVSYVKDGNILFGGSLSEGFENMASLFSPSELFWGGSALYYTLCALSIMIFLFVAVSKGKKLKNNVIYIPILSAGCSCVALYFSYPLIFSLYTAIRYIIPVLIAVALCVIFIFLKTYTQSMSNGKKTSFMRILSGMSLIIYAIIILGFFPFFSQRVYSAFTHHNTLSFYEGTVEYQKIYCKTLFADNVRKQINHIQHNVKEGSAILSLISAPFALDYKRNDIYSIDDILGLTAPWVNFPLHEEAEIVRDYFLRKKIDYVLWEYNSDAVRRALYEYKAYASLSEAGLKATGVYGLFIYDRLSQIVKKSKVVFNNGHIVLFEL